MIGHCHGQTREKSETNHKGIDSRQEAYLLEEATTKYGESKDRSQEQPHRYDLQAQPVLQWAWLCQAKEELPHYTHNEDLPIDLVEAVSQGQQAVKQWLTQTTRQQAPT